MNNTISTWSRFLYLNTYAILLILLGGIVIGIPFWKNGFWWLIPQGIFFILFLRGGVRIMQSWDDKKRQYYILMTKNAKSFRPDTFKEYMEVPCGRLLTRIVLKDLGQSHKYKTLLIYKQFFISRIIKDCVEKPQFEIHFFNQGN